MSPLILFYFLYVGEAANLYSYEQLSRSPPQIPGLQSIDELALASGAVMTNYEVVTDDGYCLWLHRLGNNSGPPVLVAHGVFMAADCWLARDPNKSLAFMLLDSGFDVWLSNQRGTAYNERHLNYSRSDPKFWDFSFHEAGYYDLPAFIDTVLSVRGKEKLFYIGHSLGATVFLVMGATRPEYNSKVATAVLLAPVAYSPARQELGPAMQLFLRYGSSILEALLRAGQYEVLGRTEGAVSFLKAFCRHGTSTQNTCFGVASLWLGAQKRNVDENEWDTSIAYFGAGTSLKTVRHCFQLYQLGDFRQYDYRPKGNRARYKSPTPPQYNVSLISAPVGVFYSRNDPLLSKSAVRRLTSRLPNLTFSRIVPDISFSHMDMYIGARADNLVYTGVIKYLRSFS